MARQKKLTLIELIVIVGLVALVAHSLLNVRISRVRPIGREREEAIRCLSNLRQWALVFSMYTEGNDGLFFTEEGPVDGRWWLDATRHFWQPLPKILRCPNATKPYAQTERTAFGAWKVDEDVGSYGLNGWACNPREGETSLSGSRAAEYCWRAPDVENADNVPLLMDATWFDGWPRHTDIPPYTEHWAGGDARQAVIGVSTSQMSRFCVNRHEGYVNVLFMDWSVRKVGLKELWTLKWHRNYIVDGPWTKAGGVLPTDWPEWMRNFRDY